MKKFITVLLVTTGLSNFAFGFIDQFGDAVKQGFKDVTTNVDNFAQAGIDQFGAFAKEGIDIAGNAAKGFTGQVGNFVEGAGYQLIDAGRYTAHTTLNFVGQATTNALNFGDFAFKTGEAIAGTGLQVGAQTAHTIANATGQVIGGVTEALTTTTHNVAAALTGGCNCNK